MARVGLVFGGRSVEHRVSIQSARTVADALARAGHEVHPLAIAEDGCWLDAKVSQAALDGVVDALPAIGQPIGATMRRLLDSDVEVVFPILHGTWGEDGTLQGLCEMLDLPYVGAGVAASAVCMDKLGCKRQLANCGLPVVDFEAVSRFDFATTADACLERLQRLGLPVFVKPSRGGSSVGVRRVDQVEDLAPSIRHALTFDDMVLVEIAIAGRELECSVLGDEQLTASAVGEIVPGNEFYDYEDKYLLDTAQLQMPADLSGDLEDRIRGLAVRAFAAVGGHGMARVDFLLAEDGGAFINEINTLPGFTRISMYPKLWEISGLPLPDLVGRLVQIALDRATRQSQLDDSIRTWLDSLNDRPDG